MGTRSLTYVYLENNARPVVCMYRQMDGYPSGHGLELAQFLNGIRINGFGLGDNSGVANGMGCLAAQVVQHFKHQAGVGGIYLEMPRLNADCWQEYEYHVKHDKVGIKVDRARIKWYTWDEFLNYCKSEE